MKCENCNKEHNGTYASGRFCSSKCARGFSTKEKRSLINNKLKSKIPWNKGISGSPYIKKCFYCQIEYITIKKNQIFCSPLCRNNFWFKGKKLSKQTKEKIKNSTLEVYKKGKKIYGGTTKWFNYKNIRVQGTFELRTCYILDKWKEQGKIKDWEYTKDRIEYVGVDNKKHMYLLDFKIWNNNTWYYLEIKGYKHPNDDLKWQSVRNKGFNLEIWFLEDIKKYEMVS
jgi:hypothetical protein